jgi:HAMP domain-containing protein
VDHLVRRLCDVGFLERRTADRDRRVRLLAATEALWSHHARWLAAHYAPLATLFPEHDYGPPLSLDRAYHVLHCRWRLPFTAVGARLMMGLPDTLLFFSHSAGPLIANAILKSAMDSGDPTAAVPYQEAADRFGVSATHVRILMRSAEAATSYVVKDRGLVILTSCSHRGVLNTVRQAQAATGVEKVHALLGGFHLTPPLTDDYVERVVRELKALNPDYVIPGHCSGERFYDRARAEMPGRILKSVVGSKFTFGA